MQDRDAAQIAERIAEINAEERRLLQTLDRLRRARELLVSEDSERDESDDSLAFVDRVRRWHGAIFAKEMLDGSLVTEMPYEAFGKTGIIAWPDDFANETPAKVRYKDIEDEILTRTFDAVREAMATAFVKVARDVVERERKCQQRRERQP
ncbi:MAG: hypothetical protein ACXW5U_11790 [Thermoanaerobaculia bacterium]